MSAYEAVTEAMFPDGSLKRELAEELMDFVESEYFAGALYELLHASFKAMLQGFLVMHLIKTLQQKQVFSGGASAHVDKTEAKIPVV